jgi:putative protein kinase ArgK-like GTPase of G3E family
MAMQKVLSQAIQKEHQINVLHLTGFSFAGKSYWTSSETSEMIGDEGRVVEIDESKVQKKENVTRFIM